MRYQTGEDVIQIVKDIAKHTTGEDLHENEISVAHRIMSKENRDKLDAIPFNPHAAVTKENSPSIIVKFCRRNTRAKVFDHRKQNATKPNSPHPKAEIYEDVTPIRSRILYALRNRSDGSGNKLYRYVWSREGRLYCRTETEAKQTPQPSQDQLSRGPGRASKPGTHLIVRPKLAKKKYIKKVNNRFCPYKSIYSRCGKHVS